MRLTVGDRVRIERDENKYPAKGSWSFYRGKTGTVIEISAAEIGVELPRDFIMDHPTWFQPYEIKVLRTG